MLLVCTALHEEASIVQSVLKKLQLTGSEQVDLLVCGMGKKKAAQNLEKYIREKGSPDGVLLVGYAGGLNPELNAADILIEEHGEEPILDGLDWDYPGHCQSGSFYSHESIASSHTEKAALFKLTKADAVDMESEAIASVCARHGIPSAVIKAISDPHDEELPLDFGQFTQSDGTLNLAALIRHILLRPWLIPGLVKLGRTTQKCRRHLASILTVWILHITA